MPQLSETHGNSVKFASCNISSINQTHCDDNVIENKHVSKCRNTGSLKNYLMGDDSEKDPSHTGKSVGETHLS